jgi:hypothetical protein
MPKGRADRFLGLYAAILKDVAAYHPNLVKGLDRDLSRLKSLVKQRGENVFLLDLPAVGKVFDRSLDDGVLQPIALPTARRINTRTNIPRLFQGLWLRVFTIDGVLQQNIDSNDVLFLRTLFFALKKYRKNCTPASLYKAIEEFYDVESQLPPPSHHWDGDGSSLFRSDLGHLHDLVSPGEATSLFGNIKLGETRLLDDAQRVADIIASGFGEFLPQNHRFRHGPGAVSDASSAKSYKYSFPAWGARLQQVFPGEVFALANPSILGYGFDLSQVLPLREGCSRLIAVPKTQKGPRLIASEPTCHQWAQQSIRDFLDGCIRTSFIGDSIDFRRQDLSGTDALAASVDGSRATVDLSSASDRLSCYVVQRIFRRNLSLLGAMIASRTRFIENREDKKSPRLHKLRKFSSMGSALTFPVQSLCFFVLCVAAGLNFYGLTATPRRIRKIASLVRVYGDDLIVPAQWMPLVRELLTLCKLKVNDTKTYSVGNFRESCGTDAYKGDVVTPAQVLELYDESRLTSVQSVVDTSNNLHMKGFWHAADWLKSSLPPKIKRLIMVRGTDVGCFGFESFSKMVPIAAKKRWNEDLQINEYLALSFIGKKARPLKFEGFANLLQYFTEDPYGSQISNWESGVVGKPTVNIRRGWVAPGP